MEGQPQLTQNEALIQAQDEKADCNVYGEAATQAGNNGPRASTVFSDLLWAPGL